MGPVLAAVLAGVTVLLGWRPSPLGRLEPRRESGPWRLPGPLRARPDAMAARTRGVCGAGVAAGVAGWLGDVGWAVALPAALAAGVGAYVGLGLLEPAESARRRERLSADLPQALRLVAACLAAGLPLRRAVAVVAQATGGPVAELLRGVTSQVDVGVAEPDAWLSLRTHPVVGPLARDVARAVDSGTALHGVLLHRAAELQSDHRAAVEARAKAVGVRTVLPLSLCFLPAFLLLGIVPVIAGMLLPAIGP